MVPGRRRLASGRWLRFLLVVLAVVAAGLPLLAAGQEDTALADNAAVAAAAGGGRDYRLPSSSRHTDLVNGESPIPCTTFLSPSRAAA